MWVLNQLLHSSRTKAAAQMGSIATDGTVRAQTSYTGVQMCGPWGVRWRAPEGTRAVLMKTDSGEVCAGAAFSNLDIQPGELLLFSQGGAQIYLKASGEVVINGQTFPAVKKEGKNGNETGKRRLCANRRHAQKNFR